MVLSRGAWRFARSAYVRGVHVNENVNKIVDGAAVVSDHTGE